MFCFTVVTGSSYGGRGLLDPAPPLRPSNTDQEQDLPDMHMSLH